MTYEQLVNDFLIGKPYSFRSFNCWDYAVKIRKMNNIVTKQFKPRDLTNAFEVITAEMQKLDHGLTKVSMPQNFDIIILDKRDRGRLIYHCGIYHDGNVAHCSRASGQVLYESYKDFTNSYDGAVIWR